jgi:hypothetical protein
MADTKRSDTYLLHSKQWFDELKPKGPTERCLVQFVIDTTWRLQQIPALETRLLTEGTSTLLCRIQAVAQLSKDGERRQRELKQTLDVLRKIQKERRARGQDQEPEILPWPDVPDGLIQ